MTRQLHAAVPTSKTPGVQTAKTEHSNEGLPSIEFLRSTGKRGIGVRIQVYERDAQGLFDTVPRHGENCESHRAKAPSLIRLFLPDEIEESNI
jgi:hypothetical protein